jgi:hypothetical protein
MSVALVCYLVTNYAKVRQNWGIIFSLQLFLGDVVHDFNMEIHTHNAT